MEDKGLPALQHVPDSEIGQLKDTPTFAYVNCLIMVVKKEKAMPKAEVRTVLPDKEASKSEDCRKLQGSALFNED